MGQIGLKTLSTPSDNHTKHIYLSLHAWTWCPNSPFLSQSTPWQMWCFILQFFFNKILVASLFGPGLIERGSTVTHYFPIVTFATLIPFLFLTTPSTCLSRTLMLLSSSHIGPAHLNDAILDFWKKSSSSPPPPPPFSSSLLLRDENIIKFSYQKHNPPPPPQLRTQNNAYLSTVRWGGLGQLRWIGTPA